MCVGCQFVGATATSYSRVQQAAAAWQALLQCRRRWAALVRLHIQHHRGLWRLKGGRGACLQSEGQRPLQARGWYQACSWGSSRLQAGAGGGQACRSKLALHVQAPDQGSWPLSGPPPWDTNAHTDCLIT